MSSMAQMLRILTATLIILGAMGPPPAATGANVGEVLDRIKKDGSIRMPIQSEWAPLSFTDASGSLTGFDYEVARKIARRMGVTLELVTNPDGSNGLNWI